MTVQAGCVLEQLDQSLSSSLSSCPKPEVQVPDINIDIDYIDLDIGTER